MKKYANPIQPPNSGSELGADEKWQDVKCKWTVKLVAYVKKIAPEVETDVCMICAV